MSNPGLQPRVPRSGEGETTVPITVSAKCTWTDCAYSALQTEQASATNAVSTCATAATCTVCTPTTCPINCYGLCSKKWDLFAGQVLRRDIRITSSSRGKTKVGRASSIVVGVQSHTLHYARLTDALMSSLSCGNMEKSII